MRGIGQMYYTLIDLVGRHRSRLTSHLSGYWLIGTLFRCSAKNFLGAMYELTHGLIFATMPFWLGGLVVAVTASSQPPAPSWSDWLNFWWVSTVSTFSGGELLVFAISLLSPTLWLTSHEPDGAQLLPHRRPISTLAVVVILVGAVFFALTKSGGISASLPIVFWLSVYLTIMSGALRYMVLVYNSYRMPPVSEMALRQPTQDWLASVDSHRRAST